MLAAKLPPELEEADEGNDLTPSLERQVEPLLLRRCASRQRAEKLRKVHTVRLHNVTAEGHHGNAAVLNLCLPQEPPGCIVALAPEVCIGKAKGVEVADRRV